MSNIIPFPQGRNLPEGVREAPVLQVIDGLLSHETENMRWLREAGPIARRLNEESKFDPTDGDAA